MSSCHVNNPWGSWLKCCSRFLKHGTCDGWLLQTKALTMKPDWYKIPRQSIRSSLSQSALILASVDDLIMSGIKFPSQLSYSRPILCMIHVHCYSPPNHQQNTLHIFVSTFRQTLDTHHWEIYSHFRGSVHIWKHLSCHCNNDNDGCGKCSSSIRYDWMDVYRNSNAYLTILAE